MTATILVVDDEENARLFISDFLNQKGYEVKGVANLKDARTRVNEGVADIILLDVQLPDGFGTDLLRETASMPLRPPIIIITAHADIDMAVEAMKNGAHDFLQKPIELEQLERSVQRATELVAMRRELNHLRQNQRGKVDFVIGQSPGMLSVVAQSERAATVSASVLITGETGTGKDLLARFIHQRGPRAIKPYVAINCAAIQSTVLESELFGYEPGAYTSAEKRKEGLMEVADGGILFLDEISTMGVDTQAKLLRAVEEQAFRRVGGTALIKVDFQLIAASNRDLPMLIKEGAFREDLYYRLKVVDLHLPPLRERKADIPELVGLIMHQLNPRMGLNIQDIDPHAMEKLVAYDWPGNIRQLANAIERAMLFCDEASLGLQHLPPEIVTKPKMK
ncbi:MAG: sigma-54-dependent Fis family transcriptional regulator [Anaerolineaceae bacterium]|nr:sigma-54-dependent Fis family transcriptional regulator [Anaerolineaceae bacterium]